MKNTITLVFFSFLLVFASCKDEDPVDETPQLSIPEVTTLDISDLTNSSVKSGGTIVNAGGSAITERGVCYSELPMPNINNDVVKSGNGEGSFVAEITGLSKSTKYYVRAYATNATGTGYGNEIEFTTSSLESFEYGGNTLFLHPTNSGSGIWGPDGVTDAKNTIDGKANTSTISAVGGSHLANKCADLDAFGFTDWYMPSFEELKALRTAANSLNDIGENDGAFWSSTENTSGFAFLVAFNTSSGFSGSTPKNQTGSCRCVRKN